MSFFSREEMALDKVEQKIWIHISTPKFGMKA